MDRQMSNLTVSWLQFE